VRRQPGGILGQVAARRLAAAAGQIALAEQQGQHPQHLGQPLVQLVVAGDAARDGGGDDRAPRPRQPLGDRGLRGHQGMGDLGGGEAADPRRVSASCAWRDSAG